MTLFVQGEQECCDLTWPSLPRWRTFKVNDNKSHFPDSSGHTCTEDKTYTNKKGTRLKSPVYLLRHQQLQQCGQKSGAQLPGLPHHPTLLVVQRSWGSAELTERQF